ncbi:MAG: hypothetical protein ACREFD_08250 [Stellaceae bacterium]
MSLWLVASAAFGQVVPGPGAGRTLVIRNRQGKVIESLRPHGNHYDVFSAQQGFIPAGRAEMRGQRLVIYDRHGNIVATARPELLPPDSPLEDITVVRNTHGAPIGTIGRY